MKKITVFFCLIAILIGCNRTPKVDILAETEAIRNLENQWTVALQNKDTDKILSFYSSDGVAMKPAYDIFVGLQGIRKQTELDFADTALLWNTYSTTIDIIEVSTSGDLGYVRGTLQYKYKSEAQTDYIDKTEKYVDIWKKIDGQWKCVVGIWNTNNP